MTRLRIVNTTVEKRKQSFTNIQSLEQKRIYDGMNFASKPDTSFTIREALSPKNSARNRYSNVNPYDYNRVTLPTSAGYSDYINASYVQMSETNKYIAAQGPLQSTVHHFWAMCWNESEKQKNDIIVIVMVTPLVEGQVSKCYKYWPSDGSIGMEKAINSDGIILGHQEIDQFSIEFIKSTYSDEGDFLITELNLKLGGRIKKVYHLYYYNWADAKTPPSLKPLISLSLQLKSLQETCGPNSFWPIVHCSAGVGRTGTFIAIDYLLSGCKDINSKTDAIEQVVEKMRCQRMMMVQTVHQFNYLYEVIDNLKQAPKEHSLHWFKPPFLHKN